LLLRSAIRRLMRNSWPHSRRRGAGVLPLRCGAPPTLCGDGGSRRGYDLPRPQRLPCGAWPAIAAPAGYWLKPPWLPLSRQGRRDSQGSARKPAQSRLRHRLESPNPAVCALSPTKRRRHKPAGRHSCGGALDRRLPMGDRPRGRTRVNRTSHTGRTGRGGSHGEELPSLVMWPGCGPTDCCPTPSARPRKAPKRRHGRR